MPRLAPVTSATAPSILPDLGKPGDPLPSGIRIASAESLQLGSARLAPQRRGWDLGSSPAPVVGGGSREWLEAGTREQVGRADGVGVCVHQLHDAGAGDLRSEGCSEALEVFLYGLTAARCVCLDRGGGRGRSSA